MEDAMLLQEVVSNYLSTISYVLQMIGMFVIFKKVGKKAWYSLIPVLNEYELARVAKRDLVGRVLVLFHTLNLVVTLTFDVFLYTDGGNDSVWMNIILLLEVAVSICILMLEIRVYNGLCEVFGKKKRWIAMWTFLPGITSLIWGFSKKIVPVMKIEDEKGVEESGHHVEELEDGLTVNIRKRTASEFFKRKTLLKDIHIGIPKGHMVLLLGGSGAGKTTFLNAVTGYEKADASILLGGRDLYKEYDSMKYDVGFVPQQDLMRGNDTVLMTLEDAATLRLPGNIKHREKKKRVQEVLEGFGLSMLANTLVDKLSGGQRKRLSIAMEFICDPSLFILDEPDSGLDGVVARGLFEKLRAIADSGKIVIVITHTPDRVADLFDEVIVLAKDVDRTGRLAFYGSIEEAKKFFGKDSMEHVLLAINQKEEGGEGRANEFVSLYNEEIKRKAG